MLVRTFAAIRYVGGIDFPVVYAYAPPASSDTHVGEQKNERQVAMTVGVCRDSEGLPPSAIRRSSAARSWLLNFPLFGIKHFRTSDSEPPKQAAIGLIERLAWLVQNPATAPLARRDLRMGSLDHAQQASCSREGTQYTLARVYVYVAHARTSRSIFPVQVAAMIMTRPLRQGVQGSSANELCR